MEFPFSTPEQCCGCAACLDICPQEAISMADRDGFDYPRIDPDKCVRCGLCQKVCPFAGQKQDTPNSLAAYACRHSDDVRLQSASGGVFTALSDRILAEGGAVYGACFDGAMTLRHARATSPEARNAMRGSKYIQSSLAGIHRQVKADLDKGMPVLFTGTPCQVAALKAFLGRPREKLLTADVICHGVPSPRLWEQFIAWLNQIYKGQVTHYAFRDKSVSWRRYSPKVTFADGRQVGSNDHTGAFIELFRYDVCLRPACTVCPYATEHRQGDLTMGDFWGIETVLPALDDGKGVSAVLVNSQKGLEALRDTGLSLSPCTPEQIAARQPNLRRPSQYSNKAEAFQKDLKNRGFAYVLKKYTRAGLRRRVLDLIKKLLRR